MKNKKMGFLENVVVLFVLIIFRDMFLYGPLSNGVYMLRVSLHGMYRYAETQLMKTKEELHIINNTLESCDTVTTASPDGLAIGFGYSKEECKLLSSKRYELSQKVSKLHRWINDLTPKEQYYQMKSI